MKRLIKSTKQVFTNITKDVEDLVKDETGLVHIFSTHTTATVAILEDEELLKKDMQQFLEGLAPETLEYRHNDVRNRTVPPRERLNAHSHLKSMLMSPSVTVPAIDGELQLGKWQSIFLVELDPFRERTILVNIIQSK